jgi:nickel/cobalt transporter (NicO) family protein
MAGLVPCPLTMMIGVALTLSGVAILSIILRERLVRFVEGRPRLFDIITRAIEGVAGAALITLALHEIFLR